MLLMQLIEIFELLMVWYVYVNNAFKTNVELGAKLSVSHYIIHDLELLELEDRGYLFDICLLEALLLDEFILFEDLGQYF